MADPAIVVRKMVEEDKAFILSTWLRGYRHSSTFAQRVTNEVYYRWHHLLLERLLARETAVALVACLDDSPEVILGYLAMEKQDASVLHWVYVKADFRRMGIARKLIDAAGLPRDLAGVEFTHATDRALPRDAKKLWDRPFWALVNEKAPNALYCPWRI